jgi:integrase/recombinase XerD
MTPTALTTTDRALTTTDVMMAFGAFLRLYVADGDASPETIRSYYGNAAQFVVWCGEHGINPATVTEDDIAIYRKLMA